MEVTLEKIELVKDRTGATYKEAKDALEAADGSVVDAIIAIEETINSDFDDTNAGIKDSKIIEKAKEIIAKGNMSRIIVRNGDDIVVNFPLTVGVVGAVLVPWGVIFGTIAAIGFKCGIEFVNNEGEIVDINGAVVGAYDKAMETGKKVVDDFTAEGGTADKISEWVYTQSEKIETTRNKSNEMVSEFVDKSVEFSKEVKDKIDELNIKGKIEELNINDKIDSLKIKENLEALKVQAENAIKKAAPAPAATEEEIQMADEIDVNEDIEEVISETEEANE